MRLPALYLLVLFKFTVIVFHASIVIEIFCVHLLLCLYSTAPAVVFCFKVLCVKVQRWLASRLEVKQAALVYCLFLVLFLVSFLASLKQIKREWHNVITQGRLQHIKG